MRKIIGLCFFSLLASCSVSAQDADSLLHNNPLLTYNDSLSIFKLIDSLLTMEDVSPGSQLAARLSYNSNVLSAGRTLGIQQFGLSPGIAYYHKSGLFADVSSFWSKDFDPEYYLTILSAGYMHSFSKKFSVIASYDRYFYNTKIDNAYIPYKNTLTLTPYLDLKYLSFRADYSYYFGDETAHRIMPSMSINLTKRNFHKIDKISFCPTAYFLLGTQKLTNIEVIFPKSLLERIQNYNRYGTPYRIVATERVVFGLMNYAFSFPLYISYKNWNFNVCYTYSIPKAVDGEPLVLSESGFLSGGITYYLHFKKKNKGIF